MLTRLERKIPLEMVFLVLLLGFSGGNARKIACICVISPAAKTPTVKPSVGEEAHRNNPFYLCVRRFLAWLSGEDKHQFYRGKQARVWRAGLVVAISTHKARGASLYSFSSRNFAIRRRLFVGMCICVENASLHAVWWRVLSGK